MAGTYAADTSVSSDRSRAEIERTLARYGARSFMYGYDPDRAIIMFETDDRQVRFVLPLPSREDDAFKWTSHKPRRRRTVNQQLEAYEQAVRQRWRALNLVIKAKLEAVESGITTFDTEFMAQLILPDGRTVGEYVRPAIVEAYETKTMPSLLPELGPRAIESGSRPSVDEATG